MLLLTFFLLGCVLHSQCQLISFPLMRMKSPRHAMLEVGTDMEQVLAHDRLLFGKPKPKPRTNDSVALFKYWDSEFYGEISLGHPAQKFKVVFDTAWANTWVPSSKCSYLSVACWLHNRYNSKASSTYYENGTQFDIELGNGTAVKGFLSIDEFHIGHLTMTNITFAEAVTLPGVYLFSKADGVVGLAYSTFAVDGVLPIFYSLVKRGLISKPVFSFYLNRDHTTERAGNLILGGSEPKHYNGSFTYLSVTEKAYWKIKMDRISMKLGNKTYGFCLYGCDAILDSSTVTLSGPPAEVQKINTILDATFLLFGRWKVPCNSFMKLPVITFVFAGKEFPLRPLDYIQQLTYLGTTVCLTAFTSTEDPSSSMWLIGGAFMSRYYTEFDLQLNRVGFALANA